jgi:hypothetical protein
MSHRVFRSPSSSTAAAATVPSRLAHEVEGRARWRELPDGTIEVARLTDDGRLERFQIEQDGATTLLDVTEVERRRWAASLGIAGAALFLGTLLFLGVSDPDGTGEHSGALFVALIGFVLVGVGGVAYHSGRDIDARLKKTFGKNAGWNEPTNLDGWTPRSTAQLGRVEQLADDHEGVAFVRDVGGRTIEVYTKRRGRFEHYWVDEDGRAELVDSSNVGPRFVLDRALRALCGVLFFGGLAASFLADDRQGVFLVIAFAGFLLMSMAGALNEKLMSVERRIKRERTAGDAWHRIRTWVEEDDGGSPSASSPRTSTRTMSSESSSTTTSASEPGASVPSSGRPAMRAGTDVAAASAASTGAPSATRLRTASIMHTVLPASTWSALRATPSSTSKSTPARVYAPSPA